MKCQRSFNKETARPNKQQSLSEQECPLTYHELCWQSPLYHSSGVVILCQYSWCISRFARIKAHCSSHVRNLATNHIACLVSIKSLLARTYGSSNLGEQFVVFQLARGCRSDLREFEEQEVASSPIRLLVLSEAGPGRAWCLQGRAFAHESVAVNLLADRCRYRYDFDRTKRGGSTDLVCMILRFCQMD